MLSKLFTLFIISTAFISSFGQSSPLLINKCWDFNSDQMTNIKNASDNNSILIIPQANSKIIALSKLGQIIWNTEISGKLISEIFISGSSVFFLTENNENQKKIYLESISIGTGVILWRKELTIIEGNSSVILSNLSSNDGVQILQKNVPVYQFDFNGIGLPLSLETRNIYTLSSNPSPDRIYFNKKGETLIIDTLNRIIQLDSNGRKKRWVFRLGAGIDSVEETKDFYLLTSLDNYVYSISIKSGKLLWKKRMEGRTKAKLIEDKKQFVSSVINGRVTIFTEIEKGKTSNQILLDEGSYFLNEPLILDNLIVLTTNKGVTAYSLGTCTK